MNANGPMAKRKAGVAQAITIKISSEEMAHCMNEIKERGIAESTPSTS